eukprot:3982405-Pyramimonas_sp.AAC.1
MNADVGWSARVSKSKLFLPSTALNFVLRQREQAVVASGQRREASAARLAGASVVHLNALV